MENADIIALMTPRKRGPKKFMMVENRKGGLDKVARKTSKVGKFDGRLGTPHRSRKGRVYRKPNGYVYYLESEAKVIAYTGGK